jgi:hypothetical protein
MLRVAAHSFRARLGRGLKQPEQEFITAPGVVFLLCQYSTNHCPHNPQEDSEKSRDFGRFDSLFRRVANKRFGSRTTERTGRRYGKPPGPPLPPQAKPGDGRRFRPIRRGPPCATPRSKGQLSNNKTLSVTSGNCPLETILADLPR